MSGTQCKCQRDTCDVKFNMDESFSQRATVTTILCQLEFTAASRILSLWHGPLETIEKVSDACLKTSSAKTPTDKKKYADQASFLCLLLQSVVNFFATVRIQTYHTINSRTSVPCSFICYYSGEIWLMHNNHYVAQRYLLLLPGMTISGQEYYITKQTRGKGQTEVFCMMRGDKVGLLLTFAPFRSRTTFVTNQVAMEATNGGNILPWQINTT